MNEHEPQSEVDKLLASLDNIEAQREVLGDLIDPLVTDIKTRLAEQIPQPSEEQQRVHDSWMTVLQTTEDLGVEAPTPTPEIREATAAVENHQKITQRLGLTGLTKTVETREVEPQPKEETPSIFLNPKEEPLATPEPRQTASLDGAAESMPATSTETEAFDKVIITDGKKEFIPKESIQGMYATVLRKLAYAPEHAVEITTALRELIGTTPRELQLATKGLVELDPSVDITEALRIKGQFYGVVKVLREKGHIEHETGTLASEGKAPQTGVIRATTPIHFSETEEGTLRIEIEPKPYAVTINEYKQTVDNGRGKVASLEHRERHVFKAATRALGAIALQSTGVQSRFTRSNIAHWLGIEDSNSMHMRSTTHRGLRDVIDAFDGDFPLEAHGIAGGGYYSFTPGSTIETVSGWPEKPRFEEPVRVTFNEMTVQATIDGVTHDLLDYDTFNPGVDKVGKDRLMIRSQNLMAALSLLSEQDEISLTELVTLVSDMKTEDKEARISSWIHSQAARLNSLLDGENVVNWRKRGGAVLIDLNRRIIIEDGPKEGTPAVTAEEEKAVFQDHPEETVAPAEQPQIEDNDDTEPTLDLDMVAPRKTVGEIVQGILNLDTKTKKIIQGRLVQNGSFEYPSSVEEAGFLLMLLSRAEVLAELRNGPRFSRKTESEYKDFVSEALFACYIRTLSWGDFTNLHTAIQDHIDDAEVQHAIGGVVRSFADTTQSLVEAETSQDTNDKSKKRRANQEFLDGALQGLIEGWVPTPRNPVQAIGLLDLFRSHRVEIAEGKTQAQFNVLIASLHGHIEDMLGHGNALSLIQARTPKRAASSARAIQTSSGEEVQLGRTDTHRFPAHGRRKYRRKNGRS